MTFSSFLITFLLSICLAIPLSAGTPHEYLVKCPIGGQKTKVTGTTSCSSPRHYNPTMSLRQRSTCDFVTRLPICKKQSFPIYRDFTSDEIEKLKSVTKTDWYQDAKAESRYFRAYIIEREVNGPLDAGERFWMLQSGYFYDPKKTYGSEEFYTAWKEAANEFLPNASKSDQRTILLMSAYARLFTQEPEKALTALSRAAAIGGEPNPFLDLYSAAVRSCVGKIESAGCSPEAELDVSPLQQ